MAENSKIQWCDHTASPWYGCSHVHAGCDNCYAEAMAKRNPQTLGIWGDEGTRVKSKSFISNLLKWNKDAEANGEIVSVFPSLCDPFEDRPELEPWRREMFETIDRCRNVRLLLLTKRPENVRGMWPTPDNPHPYGSLAQIARHSGLSQVYGQEFSRRERNGEEKRFALTRPNVWLLTSISDQPTADKAVPELLKCHELTPVLGLSCEPLLGPVDLTALCNGGGEKYNALTATVTTHRGHSFRTSDTSPLNWIIVGGESGPGARLCEVGWIDLIRDQCAAADIPCFVKQLGSNAIIRDGETGGAAVRLELKDKKGGDISEWPEDLRVRQVPEVSDET